MAASAPIKDQLFNAAKVEGLAGRFAAAAPGARVVAFCPQSTLCPDLVPWETRFANGRERGDWSDRRYADTVTVVADGKTVKGCGGKILPPADVAGTSWTFMSIGGKPVASDRPTSLQFDGARLSGSVPQVLRASLHSFAAQAGQEEGLAVGQKVRPTGFRVGVTGRNANMRNKVISKPVRGSGASPRSSRPWMAIW